MTPSLFKRIVPQALQAAAISLLSFAVAGCGGGGGGDDSASAATVRPKSLDGIVLKLGEGGIQMEFIRNFSSSGALASGDEETGTLIYTSRIGIANFRIYDNIGGTQSNLWWPQSVVATTYKYRAINSTSGVLTLTGTGTIQDTYYSFQGRILNASAIIPFIRGSYSDDFFDFTETNVVEIDLTFSSNGTSVSTNTVSFRLPGSIRVNDFDTVRMLSAVSLVTGGAVPENYNPIVDPLRPSRIAPASLSNQLMSAKHGGADPTKDFTIQFVADATPPVGVGGGGSQPDEVGQGLLRVAGSAVDIALDYTWRRIGGTDSGELVLSNIPGNPLEPFIKSLNGKYTLDFLGVDNGNYTGTADADTVDPADVTGTFILLDVD